MQGFSNDYLFEKDNDIFIKKAIEANKIKIPLVSLFLDLLFHSLEAEIKIKSYVFDQLKNNYNYDIKTVLKKLKKAEDSIAKDIAKIERFLKIGNRELSILWHMHRAPRNDIEAQKPIVAAKKAVRQIYKRHEMEPVIDKR